MLIPWASSLQWQLTVAPYHLHHQMYLRPQNNHRQLRRRVLQHLTRILNTTTAWGWLHLIIIVPRAFSLFYDTHEQPRAQNWIDMSLNLWNMYQKACPACCRSETDWLQKWLEHFVIKMCMSTLLLNYSYLWWFSLSIDLWRRLLVRCGTSSESLCMHASVNLL